MFTWYLIVVSEYLPAGPCVWPSATLAGAIYNCNDTKAMPCMLDFAYRSATLTITYLLTFLIAIFMSHSWQGETMRPGTEELFKSDVIDVLEYTSTAL
jgi:hypothetical protein